MSVLKTIGSTSLLVAGQSANLDATLEQDDSSGQLFLRVTGTLGGETLTRKLSIGSEDGKDAIAGLTSAAVAAAIQADLDGLRQSVAQILTTRANVRAAVQQVA